MTTQNANMNMCRGLKLQENLLSKKGNVVSEILFGFRCRLVGMGFVLRTSDQLTRGVVDISYNFLKKKIS